MRIRSRRGKLFMGFIYLFLIVSAVCCMFPFFWMIRSALMTNSEVFVFPPKMWPDETHWDNFAKVMEYFNLFQYLKNTMTILIPVLFGTVITCPLCAYAFARLNFPGQKFWYKVALSTLMIPFIVTFIPTYVFWSSLGLTDTFWPLIIPAWCGGGTFNVFMLRSFMMGIPRSYDEAARMDGAGHLYILYKILVPLVRPALVTISLFTIMGTWNDYFYPMMYLQSEKKYTLVLGIVQFQGAYNSQWNLAMAVSAIVIIPVILVFFFGQKYFIEGASLQGGLKA